MAKGTKGYAHSCACPHCRKPDDFRDYVDHGFEPKDTTFECKYCKKFFVIAAVKTTTMIWLEPRSGIDSAHKVTPRG